MGLLPTLRALWHCLRLVLRGIKRSQDSSLHRIRLPITAAIMLQLQKILSASPGSDKHQAMLLWAACCMDYFGFMRAGELLSTNPHNTSTIQTSDVAVDSYSAPSMVRVFLQKSKTDAFGKGVYIYLRKTNSRLCPISTVLQYLAIRPPDKGPLFIQQNGSPFSRDQFVRGVKSALSAACIKNQGYTGHSFQIVPATAAAAAWVPAHLFKALGQWS